MGTAGIAVCLVPVMIQTPTFGTFVVCSRLITGSDRGAFDGFKDVDGAVRFDNVSCASGLRVIANAVVNHVGIPPGTEQSVAVRAKAPVAFLPVLYGIRQCWDIEDAAIGIA